MAGKTRVILSRPKFNYSATMQFWKRMFDVIFHDAQQVILPFGPLRQGEKWSFEDVRPTDDAILARAWFAWSEPDVEDGEREFASWPECCHWLDKDWNVETAAALAIIDACSDFENAYAICRLKELAAEPDEDECIFELPEWARVVPALDQLSIFTIEGAAA